MFHIFYFLLLLYSQWSFLKYGTFPINWCDRNVLCIIFDVGINVINWPAQSYVDHLPSTSVHCRVAWLHVTQSSSLNNPNGLSFTLSWLSWPLRRDSQLRWFERFMQALSLLLIIGNFFSVTSIVLTDDYEELPVTHAFIYYTAHIWRTLSIVVILFLVCLFVFFFFPFWSDACAYFALEPAVSGHTLYFTFYFWQ